MLQNFRLELVGDTQPVRFVAFVCVLEAVGEARRNLLHIHQQRLIGLAPPRIAARGQRAQRVAVIALATGNKDVPLGLADLQEILPRHLERGLRRLRATGDEVHTIDAFGRVAHQPIGQLFGRRCREEGRVRIGKLSGLRLDRLDDFRMAVTQARHRRTARRIDVALTVVVDDVNALAAHRQRRGDARVARKHMAHGRGTVGGST
jgi:L-alanine-DL-glutamate epimerase-like enolase superfamily enzyme